MFFLKRKRTRYYLEAAQFLHKSGRIGRKPCRTQTKIRSKARVRNGPRFLRKKSRQEKRKRKMGSEGAARAKFYAFFRFCFLLFAFAFCFLHFGAMVGLWVLAKPTKTTSSSSEKSTASDTKLLPQSALRSASRLGGFSRFSPGESSVMLRTAE